ncbi:hypothetical protein V6N12_042196 [Hibiscus sabdariffa]|uniref:Uncharacterized protein n=1 Tax=Hibiscus sabdariffa TaxID=183260 RepID=A0ABR2EE36_9ROSI
MSQIETRLLWLVRSVSSPFDVATILDLRCCSGGRYGCTRVPEKILSLLFSFSVCASTTQGPKCLELRLNSYGSRKDDSLSLKPAATSIPKTTTECLKGQISRGYATQKVLIREAKNYAAVASVVGICKHSALGVEEHSLKIQSLFWLFKLV